MTNYRFFFRPVPARSRNAALALLLALPLLGAQAQGLKPSGLLRLPDAAASAPVAGRAGAATQRPADFIIAIVNSEPITNNELRTKLIRTER